MSAALLSGLVFPGTGQLYLKRITRGLAFIVPTALSASILFQSLFARAADLLGRIESGSVPLNAEALEFALSQQPDPGILVSLSGWLLLVLWLASVADAWRLGRPKNGA